MADPKGAAMPLSGWLLKNRSELSNKVLDILTPQGAAKLHAVKILLIRFFTIYRTSNLVDSSLLTNVILLT